VPDDRKQKSELWLEDYARRLGLDGADLHHPELGGSGKRPDYRLARGATAAICEVKEFRTSVITDRLMAAPRQTASISNKEQFGTVRDAISKAAAQLKPYRDRGDALVVVLANPNGADVSLSPEDVMAAMYGNPGVRITFNKATGETVDESSILQRDGTLSAKHAYVSAVVALYQRSEADDYLDRWSEDRRREHGRPEPGDIDAQVRYLEAIDAEYESGRVPDGTYIYANVFDTIASASGEATPLPRGFLEDERSEHYSFDPDAATYGLTNARA
jgi:hypothetical protein